MSYQDCDRKENMGMSHRSSRRSSILKMAEMDKKSEVDLDETTSKTKKLRRVSFSAKIDVKEIDESLQELAQREQDDSITKANTKANAQVFGDISNLTNMGIHTTQTEGSEMSADSFYAPCNNKNRTIFGEESMEIDEYDSILPINNTNGDGAFTNTYIQNDFSTLEQREITINQGNNDIMMQDELTSLGDKTFDITGDDFTRQKLKNQNRMSVKSATCNITYDLIAGNNTLNESNLNSADVTNTKKINATVTLNHISNMTMNSLAEPSLMRETSMTAKNETFTQIQTNKKVLLKGCSDVSSGNLSFSLQNIPKLAKASNFQSSATSALSIAVTSSTIAMLSACFNSDPTNFTIPEIAKVEPIEKQSLHSLFGELLARTQERVNELKTHLNKVVDSTQRLRNQELIAKLSLLKKQKDDKALKCREEREAIHCIKIELIKKGLARFYNLETEPATQISRKFCFKQSEFEKVKNDLKTRHDKDLNLEKDYEDKLKRNEKLKEIVETKSDKIRDLVTSHNQSSHLMNLYKNIFNDKTIKFKIISLDDDFIVLSFFYDLIQLEIKATNVFKDMNFFGSLKPVEIVDTFFNREKYLKYPLQGIYCKSMIDMQGNHSPNPFGRSSRYSISTNTQDLKRLHSIKIPPYLRFCVDLILGEFGSGNLMEKTNKFKAVKDLPFLISKLNLACECATNLAKDFEYFTNLIKGTNRKIEIDLKNRVVTFLLPSHPEACYYNLRLNVNPAMYYQCPISFVVDQKDLDEPFEPDLTRITKIVENLYFEKGSFRDYLRKLNAW